MVTFCIGALQQRVMRLPTILVPLGPPSSSSAFFRPLRSGLRKGFIHVLHAADHFRASLHYVAPRMPSWRSAVPGAITRMPPDAAKGTSHVIPLLRQRYRAAPIQKPESCRHRRDRGGRFRGC